MTRNKPLRPVARSKEKERALYVKDARAYIAIARKEKRYCPVEVFFERKTLPCEVHHMDGRGKNLRNKDTWLAVSRKGHKYIHAHPNFARMMGWLK